MNSGDSVAAKSTQLLRSSDEPIFRRLRDLLRQRGLQPQKCVLAEWHPEDAVVERGILVAPGERVFEFEVTYGNGDLRNMALTAVISDWRDQTKSWPTMFGVQRVEEGFILLSQEARPSPDLHPCPCCGHLTLNEPPGSYKICSVCAWQDDAVQLRWPDTAGGANSATLVQAQLEHRGTHASGTQRATNIRPEIDRPPLDPEWRPIAASDNFEPISSLGKRDAPWPEDLETLYYWRPSFWRSEQREA